MLGWSVTVFRCGSPALRDARGDADAMQSMLIAETGGSQVPSSTDADRPIARWQAGLNGTAWLTELVDTGRAVKTSRGGYPDTYLIPRVAFAARIANGLPDEKAV